MPAPSKHWTQDNQCLRYEARRAINQGNFKPAADNLVCIYHVEYPGNNKPWKDHLRVSARYGLEPLPDTKGMNRYLSERYKLYKNRLARAKECEAIHTATGTASTDASAAASSGPRESLSLSESLLQQLARERLQVTSTLSSEADQEPIDFSRHLESPSGMEHEQWHNHHVDVPCDGSDWPWPGPQAGHSGVTGMMDSDAAADNEWDSQSESVDYTSFDRDDDTLQLHHEDYL